MQTGWEAMRRIIADRAADPILASIPGGRSGLLVVKETETVMEDAVVDGVTVKVARVVPMEVAVDTGLLKELWEHEKQAARSWASGRRSDKLPARTAADRSWRMLGMTMEQFDKLPASKKVAMLRSGMGEEEGR